MTSEPPPPPSWRIVELVDGQRYPYRVGSHEWQGSERRAKALADALSTKGPHLFLAERLPG